MMGAVRAFVNSGDESRTWPGIQRPDGSTLQLEPGETADLELPAHFQDEYLKPVKTPAKATVPAKATASGTAGLSTEGAE